ncbi:MAG: ATP-dependent Zn protease, partial [Actinomycetia bacterium]|nr:ATP-dependent Zn protease [Actinomycetes bacterium]
MRTTAAGQGAILGRALADVAAAREGSRRARLRRVATVLFLAGGWLWLRLMTGNPVAFGLPKLGGDAMLWLPGVVLCVVLVLVIAVPMAVAGRSPHVLYRSSEIAIGMDDVRGAGIVKEEVTRTLDLF